MSVESHPEEVEHPKPLTYAKIALVLTVVTAIEVVVFYIEAMQPVLIPVLGALSALKFALVVMFYMHLKFDHHVFTRVLLLGIMLAMGVYLALLGLFFFSHPFDRL